MGEWLYKNLQNWSPFSVLLVLAGLGCIFIIVWDNVYGIPIPSFIYALISIIVGGTGASSLITHGANVVNGTATTVASAVIQAQGTAAAIVAEQQNPGGSKANVDKPVV